jgi:methionine aminopeptidase
MMSEGLKGPEIHQSLMQHCESRGVALVPEGAGHGIGHSLHQLPSLTYDGRPHEPLISGRAYTAEPVFSSGNGIVNISRNGIAETRDRKPSAYFEVTVFLADNGVRIFGAPDWLDNPPC